MAVQLKTNKMRERGVSIGKHIKFQPKCPRSSLRPLQKLKVQKKFKKY